MLQNTGGGDAKGEFLASNGLAEACNQIGGCGNVEHAAELCFGIDSLGDLLVSPDILVRPLLLDPNRKFLAIVIVELQECIVVLRKRRDVGRGIARLDLRI